MSDGHYSDTVLEVPIVWLISLHSRIDSCFNLHVPDFLGLGLLTCRPFQALNVPHNADSCRFHLTLGSAFTSVLHLVLFLRHLFPSLASGLSRSPWSLLISLIYHLLPPMSPNSL